MAYKFVILMSNALPLSNHFPLKSISLISLLLPSSPRSWGKTFVYNHSICLMHNRYVHNLNILPILRLSNMPNSVPAEQRANSLTFLSRLLLVRHSQICVFLTLLSTTNVMHTTPPACLSNRHSCYHPKISIIFFKLSLPFFALLPLFLISIFFVQASRSLSYILRFSRFSFLNILSGVKFVVTINGILFE